MEGFELGVLVYYHRDFKKGVALTAERHVVFFNEQTLAEYINKITFDKGTFVWLEIEPPARMLANNRRFASRVELVSHQEYEEMSVEREWLMEVLKQNDEAQASQRYKGAA